MAKSAGDRRLRRKDLKHPDEFETLVGQSTQWAQLHRPLVLGAAAVVLGVALVAVLVSRFQASQAEAAATAFRTAHDDFTANPTAERYDQVGTLNLTADILLATGVTALAATTLVRWLWPPAKTSQADIAVQR